MTSKENQARTDFSTLALSPATLANLQQLGYTTMTPIQAASLPPALLGKDLIAQASTGSGKTAAFALALLANLNPRRFAVQALVLCPTRELADQVTTEIRRLARALSVPVVVDTGDDGSVEADCTNLELGRKVECGETYEECDSLPFFPFLDEKVKKMKVSASNTGALTSSLSFLATIMTLVVVGQMV